MNRLPSEDQQYRFTDVAFQAFMTEETKRLGENVMKAKTPGKSMDKSEKSAIDLLHEFTDNILKMANKQLKDYGYDDSYHHLARIIFEFFHLEERMRPLVKVNNPVIFFFTKHSKITF